MRSLTPGTPRLCAYFIACLFLLRNARNFRQVVIAHRPVSRGPRLRAHLALTPSFTADHCGAKNVGAKCDILFTAWGICGFTVSIYFAGIMDKAKAAGDLGAG